MKVYRIEHREYKTGPYMGGAVNSYDSRYFGVKCPGPIEDGISRSEFASDHYFGFKHMRQMITWFRVRDIFRMRKRGFRVYRYKVDRSHVLLGNSQVAFARAKATVREEVRLSAIARHILTPGFGS